MTKARKPEWPKELKSPISVLPRYCLTVSRLFMSQRVSRQISPIGGRPLHRRQPTRHTWERADFGGAKRQRTSLIVFRPHEPEAARHPSTRTCSPCDNESGGC
jgi:hypothetical protein